MDFKRDHLCTTGLLSPGIKIQIIYLDGIRWLYFRNLSNEIEHKHKISWLLHHSKQSFRTVREVFDLHSYLIIITTF